MIDYRKIADAVDYYKGLGYQYIEVPWIVSKSTSSITTPEGRKNFETFMGNLVASGEQSFLDMREQLKRNTKYVCVTPCFRDEKIIDDLHRNWFMKVELIHIEAPSDITDWFNMMDDAQDFFERYGKVKRTTGSNSDEFDLEMNGIEIGSYGVRMYKGFFWVYGTGCAEPRLTQAIERR